MEGQLHHLGCDMERCPFCGHQLISCPCLDEYVDRSEAWWKRLNGKGRIPFIEYPNLCAKCGTHWPEMFFVPDAEWERYVEPQMRHEMLCEACYTQIKTWIDRERLEAEAEATERP
jgi:hypothetical protein